MDDTRASYDRVAGEYAALIFGERASKPLDRQLLDRFSVIIGDDENREAYTEMTITITLSPDQEYKLQERALKKGKGVTEYVEGLIEKDIAGAPTLDEILAPLRAQFAESGMSEAELDALVEEAREEVWQEKQSRKASIQGDEE